MDSQRFRVTMKASALFFVLAAGLLPTAAFFVEGSACLAQGAQAVDHPLIALVDQPTWRDREAIEPASKIARRGEPLRVRFRRAMHRREEGPRAFLGGGG